MKKNNSFNLKHLDNVSQLKYITFRVYKFSESIMTAHAGQSVISKPSTFNPDRKNKANGLYILYNFSLLCINESVIYININTNEKNQAVQASPESGLQPPCRTPKKPLCQAQRQEIICRERGRLYPFLTLLSKTKGFYILGPKNVNKNAYQKINTKGQTEYFYGSRTRRRNWSPLMNSYRCA